ncbi:MAG: oxygenase MpaB family protein [Gammaproteobacteria bacterium]|nr:oxygenase MpaB family protein [Gammaproteobacteria bacterium]
MQPAPSAYTEGYVSARLHDLATADNYIKHTCIGDPELDPVMEEISALPSEDLHQFIAAGIEQQTEVLRAAPQALRDAFERINEPPSWLDYKAFDPAIQAFYTKASDILLALVTGVLVEGFSTLMSKPFGITGRMLQETDVSIRQLKQVNRHLLEIFFPGGLQRKGDGWKLSVRIRFIHARVRQLIKTADEWDTKAWGTPISAAHMGFSTALFSHRLLEHSTSVGANYNQTEKDSIFELWRYVGHLMGVPETILFSTQQEAHELFKIGFMCEPPPDADAATISNALIQSIPLVAGLSDLDEQDSMRDLAYRISRALVGSQLANQLQFPKSSSTGVLHMYRAKQLSMRLTKDVQLIKSENFLQLLNASQYDEIGVSYKMPDHVLASKSSEW